MFKNLLIIITIILLSLATRSLAISNSAYELEPKYYDSYSFTVPIEMLKERDYYDQYFKESVGSNVVSLINNKYEFTTIDNRRVAKSNGEFELSFLLQQIEKNPTNKEFYNCYKGLESQIIDPRYYSIPLLSNDSTIKNQTPNSPIKIIPNRFRIIPQYAVILDFPINEPESNYNFFKYENDELKTITDKAEIIREPFNFCLETVSGKYNNGNREGIDIVYSIVNPQDKTTVQNVIKRSQFGSQDIPTVDIDVENRRIVALKNPNPPKDPNTTNNFFTFLFYGIPIIAILCFTYKFLAFRKKTKSYHQTTKK
jgi:hypothetical protein